MKINLSDEILSRQDVRQAALELHSYSQLLSGDAIKKRVAPAAVSQQVAISPAVGELINQWCGGKPPTTKALDELAEALEAIAANAQTVTLTLAAPVPQTLRKALATWFRSNVSADLLVEFGYNSTMLGGMVVRLGSHVFDWSFKRQILANIEQFPKALRNV